MDARRTSARGAASQRHPFAAPPLRPELAAALVPGATFERTFTEQITYTATVEAVDRRPSATWVDVRWEEVEPGSGAGRERLQADSLAEDHIALTAQEVRPPAPPSPRAVQNEYEEQRAAAIRRNNEMLAQLGVTTAKAAARRAEEAEAASAQRTARRNREETRCTTTAANLVADPSQLTKNQKRKRRRKLKQAAAAGDSAEAARQALEHARGQPPLRISLQGSSTMNCAWESSRRPPLVPLLLDEAFGFAAPAPDDAAPAAEDRPPPFCGVGLLPQHAIRS